VLGNVSHHVAQRANAADIADGPAAPGRRVLPRHLPEDYSELHEDARQEQKV